jgi:hypothetical protein
VRLPITEHLATGSFMRIADLKDLLMEGVAAFRRKRQQTTPSRHVDPYVLGIATSSEADKSQVCSIESPFPEMVRP